MTLISIQSHFFKVATTKVKTLCPLLQSFDHIAGSGVPEYFPVLRRF